MQIFDSSKQGFISKDDLRNILVKAFNMTDVDIDELFKEVDGDKDGRITLGLYIKGLNSSNTNCKPVRLYR